MKPCVSFLAFVFILPLVVGLVYGQTAGSVGSTVIDAATPTAFMLSYDHLAGADPDAYVPLYSVTSADDRKLAGAEAGFDAQVGMLQKIVQLKWGSDAVNQTIHALGMQTVDDINSAKVVETVDHATVTYADGTAGPMLIKTPSGWRLDTAAFRKGLGMPVKDYIKQLRQMSAIVADIAEAVDQKKLRSADAVAHDIATRTSAIAH